MNKQYFIDQDADGYVCIFKNTNPGTILIARFGDSDTPISLDHHNATTLCNILNKSEFYPLISFHIDDLKHEEYNGDNLTKEQIDELTERLTDIFANDNVMEEYWTCIRTVCEDMNLPEWHEPKDDVNEKNPEKGIFNENQSNNNYL